jgi:hypothetical protein
MKATWTQADREAAYTALCEAVTAAGPEHETQLLARLTLLLTEELADAAAFQRALEGARLAGEGCTPATPSPAGGRSDGGLGRSRTSGR